MALHVSQEKASKLSVAEEEYFTQLKSLNGRCGRWEVELLELIKGGERMAGEKVAVVELKEEHEDLCENLLQGQGEMLLKCEGMLSTLKFLINVE